MTGFAGTSGHLSPSSGERWFARKEPFRLAAGAARKLAGRAGLCVLPILVSMSAGHAAEWKANEQVRTYAISGTTGIELYESIGENGPLVGKARTVAHTTFDLKWRRNYEPQADGSCRLVSAKPFLTITYTLPKPSGKLPASLRGRWTTFIDGIERHEKVHGEHIRELVETILATTVGLTVADDRGCRKIREEIKTPLSAASLAQRQKSRDFDQVEMSEGGNVHRLILDLVNGD